MSAKPSSPAIPVPQASPSRVKSAILHVISLAQFTLVYTRSWAAGSTNPRLRMKGERDQADQEIALLPSPSRGVRFSVISVVKTRWTTTPGWIFGLLTPVSVGKNFCHSTGDRFLLRGGSTTIGVSSALPHSPQLA